VAVQRPNELEISVETTEGFTIVAIIGDSVAATNGSLLDGKLKALVTPRARFLLDMSAVRFMDSSGIGVIVSFMRAVAAKEGTLKLCGLTSSVRGLFKLIHLDQIFEICESREQAISSSVQ
jgi:anti-sigma B factor antagonist